MPIAFNAATVNVTQGASPLTRTHTASGSDRFAIVGIGFDGATQTITSVTYDGVSMTKRVDSTGDSAFDYDHQLWTLKNPSTTAGASVTVTWTGGGNLFFYIATYTGVLGDFDNSTHGASASSPLTLTLTTNTSPCWTFIMSSDGGSAPTAGTGTTNRGTDASTWLFGDSNGDVSGTTSLQSTWTGAIGGGGVMISFAQDVPVTTVSPSVQSSVFSIPSPTITVQTAVSPAEQGLTFSIPPYSVNPVNVIVSAEVQSMTFSMPTHRAIGDFWYNKFTPPSTSWSEKYGSLPNPWANKFGTLSKTWNDKY